MKTIIILVLMTMNTQGVSKNECENLYFTNYNKGIELGCDMQTIHNEILEIKLGYK